MRISSPGSDLDPHRLRLSHAPSCPICDRRDQRPVAGRGLDRADRGDDRKGGKDEGADRGGGDPGEAIEVEHVGLLNLVLRPSADHPTVTPISKQGSCQVAEMAGKPPKMRVSAA